MKRYITDIQLYRLPILYAIWFVLFIVSTGVWLYFLSQGGVGSIVAFLVKPQVQSWHRFIEIATPHVAAMGLTLFVMAHFLLFSVRISTKLAQRLSLVLFAWMFVDIFGYVPLIMGVVETGLIKAIALFFLTVSILCLAGMLWYAL